MNPSTSKQAVAVEVNEESCSICTICLSLCPFEAITKDAETDEFGHVRLGGIGHYLANQLREILHLPVRVTTLAYLQRGGQPTAFDRILATRFGVSAVELCMEGNFDRMVALKANKVVPVELEKVIKNSPKPIDKKLLEMRKIFY